MPSDMGAMSAALYFQFFSGWSTRAFEEALALLFRREVEEELDDAAAMVPEMALQVQDRTVAVMSDALAVLLRVQDVFSPQNIGMHAGDQHLLVVGPVEDADPVTLGQLPGRAPQEIVLQSGGKSASVIEPDAVKLLAARLRTPLQVECNLVMAFKETHRISLKETHRISLYVRSRASS